MSWPAVKPSPRPIHGLPFPRCHQLATRLVVFRYQTMQQDTWSNPARQQACLHASRPCTGYVCSSKLPRHRAWSICVKRHLCISRVSFHLPRNLPQLQGQERKSAPNFLSPFRAVPSWIHMHRGLRLALLSECSTRPGNAAQREEEPSKSSTPMYTPTNAQCLLSPHGAQRKPRALL